MHWICICCGLTPYTFKVFLLPCHSFVVCSSWPQRKHLLLSMNMAVCGITLPFWSLQRSNMSYCCAFCIQDLCVCGCVKGKVRESSDGACLFFLAVIPTPKWLVNIRPCNSLLNGTPDHFTMPNCYHWLPKSLPFRKVLAKWMLAETRHHTHTTLFSTHCSSPVQRGAFNNVTLNECIYYFWYIW